MGEPVFILTNHAGRNMVGPHFTLEKVKVASAKKPRLEEST